MDNSKEVDIEKQVNTVAVYKNSNQVNDFDKWRDEITSICVMLSLSPDSFDKYQTYKNTKEYLLKRKRWLYSVISDYLYRSTSTETFINNLDVLREYASGLSVEVSKETRDVEYGIIKLWDHANLAKKQNDNLRQSDEDFNKSFTNRIIPFRANFAQEMNTQLISLIAIFTALSFIVFGGITSFANILSGMSSIPIIELVILGSVWGLCMLNLIFAFMYFVAKLTKLSIKTSERDGASLSEKYPFLVWGNYFLMLIFTVSCLMYFINYSNAHSRLVEFAQQHSLWVVFAGFLLIILIFSFFALCILLPNSRRIKSSGKSSGKKTKGNNKSTNNSQ